MIVHARELGLSATSKPMADSDRIRGSLARFMRTVFPRIDYLALYPARIVKQTGQAVDLIPDDPRIPQLEAVPLNLGLPGVEVDVAPGARVLLGFAGGDPAKPRATVWESGSVTELRVTSTTKVGVTAPTVELGGDGAVTVKLADGSVPIARVGDQVTGTAGPYPLTAVIAPPGNPKVLG